MGCAPSNPLPPQPELVMATYSFQPKDIAFSNRSSGLGENSGDYNNLNGNYISPSSSSLPTTINSNEQIDRDLELHSTSNSTSQQQPVLDKPNKKQRACDVPEEKEVKLDSTQDANAVMDVPILEDTDVSKEKQHVNYIPLVDILDKKQSGTDIPKEEDLSLKKPVLDGKEDKHSEVDIHKADEQLLDVPQEEQEGIAIPIEVHADVDITNEKVSLNTEDNVLLVNVPEDKQTNIDDISNEKQQVIEFTESKETVIDIPKKKTSFFSVLRKKEPVTDTTEEKDHPMMEHTEIEPSAMDTGKESVSVMDTTTENQPMNNTVHDKEQEIENPKGSLSLFSFLKKKKEPSKDMKEDELQAISNDDEQVLYVPMEEQEHNESVTPDIKPDVDEIAKEKKPDIVIIAEEKQPELDTTPTNEAESTALFQEGKEADDDIPKKPQAILVDIPVEDHAEIDNTEEKQIDIPKEELTETMIPEEQVPETIIPQENQHVVDISEDEPPASNIPIEDYSEVELREEKQPEIDTSEKEPSLTDMSPKEEQSGIDIPTVDQQEIDAPEQKQPEIDVPKERQLQNSVKKAVQSVVEPPKKKPSLFSILKKKESVSSVKKEKETTTSTPKEKKPLFAFFKRKLPMNDNSEKKISEQQEHQEEPPLDVEQQDQGLEEPPQSAATSTSTGSKDDVKSMKPETADTEHPSNNGKELVYDEKNHQTTAVSHDDRDDDNNDLNCAEVPFGSKVDGVVDAAKEKADDDEEMHHHDINEISFLYATGGPSVNGGLSDDDITIISHDKETNSNNNSPARNSEGNDATIENMSCVGSEERIRDTDKSMAKATISATDRDGQLTMETEATTTSPSGAKDDKTVKSSDSSESDTDWESVESSSGSEGDGLKRGAKRGKRGAAGGLFPSVSTTSTSSQSSHSSLQPYHLMGAISHSNSSSDEETIEEKVENNTDPVDITDESNTNDSKLIAAIDSQPNNLVTSIDDKTADGTSENTGSDVGATSEDIAVINTGDAATDAEGNDDDDDDDGSEESLDKKELLLSQQNDKDHDANSTYSSPKKEYPKKTAAIEKAVPLPLAFSPKAAASSKNEDVIENKGIFDKLVEQLDASMSIVNAHNEDDDGSDDGKPIEKPGPPKSPGNTTHESVYRQNFDGTTLADDKNSKSFGERRDTGAGSSFGEDTSEPDFYDEDTGSEVLQSSATLIPAALDIGISSLDEDQKEQPQQQAKPKDDNVLHDSPILAVPEPLTEANGRKADNDGPVLTDHEGSSQQPTENKDDNHVDDSPNLSDLPSTPSSKTAVLSGSLDEAVCQAADERRVQNDGATVADHERVEISDVEVGNSELVELYVNEVDEKLTDRTNNIGDEGETNIKQQQQGETLENDDTLALGNDRRKNDVDASIIGSSNNKGLDVQEQNTTVEEHVSDKQQESGALPPLVKSSGEKVKEKDGNEEEIQDRDVELEEVIVEDDDEEVEEVLVEDDDVEIVELVDEDDNDNDDGEEDEENVSEDDDDEEDETDEGSKLPETKESKQMQILIDLDPWDEDSEFGEQDFLKLIEKDSECCQRKYDLESFDAEIYPLSAVCALGGSLEAIKLCYNAYPNAIQVNDKSLGTPLHYACTFGAPMDIVKFLVMTFPGSLKEVDEFKRTPLHVAALSHAGSKVVSLLLHVYPDAASRPDEECMTPLHLTIEAEDGVDMDVLMKLMKASPSSLTAQSLTDRVTPLMLAVARKSPLEVLKVIVKGNDKALMIPDKEGRIPLHVAAALKADAKTIKFLIKCYPDGVSTKDNSGDRPIDLAKKVKLKKEIRELLKP